VSTRPQREPLRIVTHEEGGDESAVIAAVRADRLDALARVFDRFHQRVRVLARRLLWDDAAAEDVVQEVFAALPRALRGFRGEAGLEAFLLSIAVRRSKHHQRWAARRRRALARFDDGGGADERTPERELYRRQLAVRLAGALDQLPHVQRVAFVLCEIDGMTSGEAAEVADVPEATVRTRLFHARRKLRELLGPERAE
jgi:RNA polymerase sigma-70 factor (ECF subfamily)